MDSEPVVQLHPRGPTGKLVGRRKPRLAAGLVFKLAISSIMSLVSFAYGMAYPKKRHRWFIHGIDSERFILLVPMATESNSRAVRKNSQHYLWLF